ncbi:MAG: GNAT family N-acetyltransferase [Pseudomonadota bacterium]
MTATAPTCEQLAAGGLDVRCADGNTYHVRRIRPSDAPLIVRGYDALPDEHKWFRVLHTLPRLTERMAHDFCTPDPDTVIAVVVEGRDHFAGELVGSARVAGVGPGQSAEFSITVRPEVSGLGLARQALEIVIQCARETGCKSVWGTISMHNARMLGLARRIGFRLRRDPDDISLMIAELEF